MTIYQDKVYDEERALYGSREVKVLRCRFDGPADGESALKESKDVEAEDCTFNLRYPFWHNDRLKIRGCEMTELCRAALWYCHEVEIENTKMHGVKALRECSDVVIKNCDIESPEFGWSVKGLSLTGGTAEGEYFGLRSTGITFEDVRQKGKYSFQYIEDSVFTNCRFDTKDAFWHAKNVLVKDSVVKGEYLAWYSENVTFENCAIIGTQPLCYCKGLKLINCKMQEADLAFEKSEVDAEIISDVVSIKNPAEGTIRVQKVGEVIMDDPEAKGKIVYI